MATTEAVLHRRCNRGATDRHICYWRHILHWRNTSDVRTDIELESDCCIDTQRGSVHVQGESALLACDNCLVIRQCYSVTRESYLNPFGLLLLNRLPYSKAS